MVFPLERYFKFGSVRISAAYYGGAVGFNRVLSDFAGDRGRKGARAIHTRFEVIIWQ